MATDSGNQTGNDTGRDQSINPGEDMLCEDLICEDVVCDIAIVGGGLAGASLAIALAPLGYRITVIEAVAFKASDQPSYDDRTLAVSHSSCRILTGMGLWDALAADATPIKKIFVSEHEGPGKVVLDPNELNLNEFGNVVEARRFGAAVTRAMEQADNVKVLCPVRVTDFKTDKNMARLTLESDTGSYRLDAKLVVAADGANSFIRSQADIPATTKDYGQTAIICNVTPQQAHQGRAFEILTATGPFAMVPHTGTRCGMAWVVATDQVDDLLALEDEEFLARAQQRFGNHLGAFLEAGKRSAYPLKLVKAKWDTANRLVVLGNAAHAIHPVGAQGFNLSLRDVAVLAEVLADYDAGDPGSDDLLQRYSDWRKRDQQSTIALSNGMATLFAYPSPLIAGLRTAGFAALALLPGLRRRMALQFMGYRGRTSRLALGEPLRQPPRQSPDVSKGVR